MLLSLGYDNILNYILEEHTTSIYTATLKTKVACSSKTHIPQTTCYIEVEDHNVYLLEHEHLKSYICIFFKIQTHHYSVTNSCDSLIYTDTIT